MPPTDASAGTGPGSVPLHPGDTGPWDFRGTGGDGAWGKGAGDTSSFGDGEDTLDLRLPDEFIARFVEPRLAHGLDDLLDQIPTWGPNPTPVGMFQLVPVRLEHDLPLVRRWMHDPAVAPFWELAGAHNQTESHLRAQIDGDGRSTPCLGVLDGTPMSYWEIYRADLDPLARHYPARPHDTGIHLLIGGAADRGRGLGSALLRAVADLVLDRRPACSRVVAEPDLRNTPSVAAFLSAGFRFEAEIDLPGKQAALMIRDRVLRGLM
ncbi:GNAT family N-acetyltransferase [Streptomyces sp. BK340]|uniref:GNAT family N-acetyltransferase n=1 Tax=Streptomyces sp. BK340 TaxID=2572903 RepID=UPI0011A184ED|nr:RimJ/RimL family protein N-acetyltransferase [Streptomyces sp. BK340]